MSRFDTETSLWRARSINHPRFGATSEASFESLLLGTNDWTISNDSLSCSKSETFTRYLSQFLIFHGKRIYNKDTRIIMPKNVCPILFYSDILSLYAPRFNFDGPLKSEVSDFQIAKFWDCLIFKLWIQNIFYLLHFQ